MGCAAACLLHGSFAVLSSMCWDSNLICSRKHVSKKKHSLNPLFSSGGDEPLFEGFFFVFSFTNVCPSLNDIREKKVIWGASNSKSAGDFGGFW